MAVSPDGATVYVANGYAKQLYAYSRDSSTGALTSIQTFANPSTDGLVGASDVVVSPDGTNVYITAADENSLTSFSRDTSTGLLTFQALLRDGVGGVDGLEKASTLVISPDGKDVYVGASAPESSVAAFARSQVNGGLTYLQKITEDQGPTPPPPATCKPPQSEIGVTINNAALYTNKPDVELTIVAPDQTTNVRLSNDGGFGSATTRTVQSGTYDWTLNSSGPERLPKTIYVRFDSVCLSASQTFTDDIILDETPPAVTSAAATPAKAGQSFESLAAGAKSFESFASSNAKGRLYRVKLRAHDNVSGVGKLQITWNKARPGKWLPYKARVTFRTTKRTIWVRVRDRAGNPSRWRKAHVVVPRSHN
jgi:hypothetical protein